MHSTRLLVAGVLLGAAVTARADGPQDNVIASVRPIPKPGIAVPPADRHELDDSLATLRGLLDRLRQNPDRGVKDLLPDVEIFWKAVHDALVYQEIFTKEEIVKAKKLVRQGQERAELLLEGRVPWTTQTGLVVRGYRSRIDGSVQPYGMVVPESYSNQVPHRLDLWFHGRGETLTELNFLDERQRQAGTFHPADTLVLHPYGRYCNAFKFAGEVDVLEALDSVRSRYRVDGDRISVRGFSMGGAACWQFAVHDADRWFAANPGAGFAETYAFLKTFQKEDLKPTAYERKLWHLYDCTDYAVNLRQCPTVAYSGALDSQKQAADVMADALRPEGIELTHIIGPGTRHAYHPMARLEVEQRMASLAQKGRERMPRDVCLVTYTLKYNRMNWVTIDALGEHWERAEVRARLAGRSHIEITTRNVTGLTLAMPSGYSEFEAGKPVTVTIDDAPLAAPGPQSDRSWTCRLERAPDGWKIASGMPSGLHKRHNLQGPMDDAFMDSFLMVRPSGKTEHSQVEAWARQEMQHAIEHWRKQFRGEARVKLDSEVTDADIASSNLVLWGDPRSNAVLARVADRLPIRWRDDRIEVGDRSYPAAHHVLSIIFPNPLNPDRYVVLNSGFTYREYDYLNNARQVPKLPDWAVIDVRTPPDSQHPGKVAAADFFGEAWELRPLRDEAANR